MKIEQHEKKAWKAYRRNLGKDWATPERFREAFEGEWDTEEAFATHAFGECFGASVP